jgi:hypothetical protein
MEDRTIGDDIMRLWDQGYDTYAIAKFIGGHEEYIERLLHKEMDRRRRLREETML